MPVEKSLSESAQWFLRDFQKLLNDFANEAGIQIVAIDREGNVITEMTGVQRVCKLILATEDGRIRCRDNYKMALSLVKAKKEPFFIDCYAGFASVWVPIIIRGILIGVIVGCGGRYDRGESQEKLREKFSKLASELGIIDKEDFLKAAIDEVKIANEDEMKKRGERLKKLVEILAETAQTPLKEVFG